MPASSDPSAPPKEGLAGLRQNFPQDVTSGFVVFLLALPLSLGIAGASGFPPVMGLLTAIIGGIVATFFTGSQLSIKGPAAGLIVIVADAVNAFGGGSTGWQLALGVMVAAGLLQILFGLLKWGKFVDLFPLAAVHGMLAAIGFIIIAKQVPVLLNVDPTLAAGKGPFALFLAIPSFFSQLDPQVSVIGAVSLAVMLGWGFVKQPLLRKIPAPLLVLFFAIPASLLLDLGENSPSHTLVQVGQIAEQVGLNVSFSGVSQPAIFLKFVVMVSLVGSLESLLTVKAIDFLDPWKRKSDPNQDLIAIGVGNSLAGVLGGLPMISEVARSSANVAQGARTRWANFFHGAFLLISVLLAYQLLELIPNAALAAMLIAVGIKLAHPREFAHMLKVGREQLAIFVVTILVTLFKDLLVGIAAGMLLKAIIHLVRGAPLRSLFRAGVEVIEDGDHVTIRFGESAIFTNYLGVKKSLDALPSGKSLRFEFSRTMVIDHSVIENLYHFRDDYRTADGAVEFIGLDDLSPASAHPLAARRRL